MGHHLAGSLDIDIPSDRFEQPLLAALPSSLSAAAGVPGAAVKVELAAPQVPVPPTRRLRRPAGDGKTFENLRKPAKNEENARKTHGKKTKEKDLNKY